MYNINLNNNMKVGTIGTLTYGDDKTTARVKLVDNSEYYWFDYLDGETNRKIIHPYYGKIPYILGPIMFPKYVQLSKVFTPDTDINTQNSNQELNIDKRIENYMESINRKDDTNLKLLLYKLKSSSSGLKKLEQWYLIPNGF